MKNNDFFFTAVCSLINYWTARTKTRSLGQSFGLQCHAIKNKNRNHSINKAKKLGYER